MTAPETSHFLLGTVRGWFIFYAHNYGGKRGHPKSRELPPDQITHIRPPEAKIGVQIPPRPFSPQDPP